MTEERLIFLVWIITLSVSSFILGIPKHLFLINKVNYLMCIKGCQATAKHWARLQNPSLSNPQVLSEEELCYPISHTGNTTQIHLTPLAGATLVASPLSWLEQGLFRGMALSAHFAPRPATSVSCHVPSPQLLSSLDRSPELLASCMLY